MSQQPTILKDDKRILRLTLHRVWFNQIASGDKLVEYRQIKDYWTKRLHGKTFDEIHFTNGYGKERPFMRVEYNGVTLAQWRGLNCYAIQLGKILEIRN